MTNDSNDIIWAREEPESPCIKLCSIHPVERICVGCLRSIEEIGAWSRMSPAERREVMDELPTRISRIQKRRGGRKTRVK